MDRKKALILGGCGRRAQKSAKKLIEDGFMVVLVDNMVSGVHPCQWDSTCNCWDSQSLVLYEDDVVHFLTSNDHIFSDTTWDVVMQFAKISDNNELVELATNCTLDSVFFRWICSLQYKPMVISPQYTIVAQQAMKYM